MTEKTRFQLKQSTGWFAAGREVACALQLLSDATFKLFVWLCLHAERSRGALSVTPAELARALGKKENDLHRALEELEQQGVCTLRAEGVIVIRDRFWPYQRQCDPAARDESQRYVAEVKRLFFERRCVQSSFTAADEKLALSLFRRGVSLIQVERAILLGAVRKYLAVSGNGRGTPISSLHYFTNLFEEVQQEISTHYWTYIAHKVKTFEQIELGAIPGRRQSTLEK
jgi:DNA-binding transcriptional regulator YhcF (GntR family)